MRRTIHLLTARWLRLDLGPPRAVARPRLSSGGRLDIDQGIARSQDRKPRIVAVVGPQLGHTMPHAGRDDTSVMDRRALKMCRRHEIAQDAPRSCILRE